MGCCAYFSGSQTAGSWLSNARLHAPVDIEVHRGYDDRLYIVDAARVHMLSHISHIHIIAHILCVCVCVCVCHEAAGRREVN